MRSVTLVLNTTGTVQDWQTTFNSSWAAWNHTSYNWTTSNSTYKPEDHPWHSTPSGSWIVSRTVSDTVGFSASLCIPEVDTGYYNVSMKSDRDGESCRSGQHSAECNRDCCLASPVHSGREYVPRRPRHPVIRGPDWKLDNVVPGLEQRLDEYRRLDTGTHFPISWLPFTRLFLITRLHSRPTTRIHLSFFTVHKARNPSQRVIFTRQS